MDRAVFTTGVAMATADGAEGRDVVAFEVATNPGAPSGPLAKIASGGRIEPVLTGAQGLSVGSRWRGER